MGSLCDCFRRDEYEPQRSWSKNVTTPDPETRRQTAAEAANRRFQQSENRGVDEEEYRRMKQKQAERERLESEQKRFSAQNGDHDGPTLRWQAN